jgi:hypothetical protein
MAKNYRKAMRKLTSKDKLRKLRRRKIQQGINRLEQGFRNTGDELKKTEQGKGLNKPTRNVGHFKGLFRRFALKRNQGSDKE